MAHAGESPQGWRVRIDPDRGLLVSHDRYGGRRGAAIAARSQAGMTSWRRSSSLLPSDVHVGERAMRAIPFLDWPPRELARPGTSRWTSTTTPPRVRAS